MCQTTTKLEVRSECIYSRAGWSCSQRNKWINCRSKCTYVDDRDADGAVDDPFPSSLG